MELQREWVSSPDKRKHKATAADPKPVSVSGFSSTAPSVLVKTTGFSRPQADGEQSVSDI